METRNQIKPEAKSRRGVWASVALDIDSCLFPLEFVPMERSPKGLTHIDDPSRVVEIDDASRAIVYISVDWSFQGLDGQKKFLLFVESFVMEMPDLNSPS